MVVSLSGIEACVRKCIIIYNVYLYIVKYALMYMYAVDNKIKKCTY